MITVELFLIQLGFALFTIILGIIFSMASVYLAIRVYDRITEGIDEIQELKKGNVAVGLLLAAIIYGISSIVASGVGNLTNLLSFDTLSGSVSASSVLVNLVLGIVQLVVSILVAVVAIYVALRVLDGITTEINEMIEIKKGNVAVAILMVAVILAVSLVVSSSLGYLSSVLGKINLLF
ncbi:Uncharacterised protein [uncultured archaeon]|nr:Uncharacterised protein [uncultured archaeon]